MRGRKDVEIAKWRRIGTGNVSVRCTSKGTGKEPARAKQEESRKGEKKINPFKVIVDINKGGYNSY